MLASSLDSAKNGGGGGRGADGGRGAAVAKEMGYRRAKQQRKRVKDQMKYIPVCVCVSNHCQAELPSSAQTEKKEICINLQFDLLSIYCIYMHSFFVQLQFT